MSWHFHLGKKANNKALQNIILYANAMLFKDKKWNEAKKWKRKEKKKTEHTVNVHNTNLDRRFIGSHMTKSK